MIFSFDSASSLAKVPIQPEDVDSGAYCLSIYLSVCLSFVNYNIRYNFEKWHAYSTNDAVSNANDTKVNDLEF